jgi:hypothetical protein
MLRLSDWRCEARFLTVFRANLDSAMMERGGNPPSEARVLSRSWRQEIQPSGFNRLKLVVFLGGRQPQAAIPVAYWSSLEARISAEI